MCFALQRRAFFQQLNFQKWFETRNWCVLYFFDFYIYFDFCMCFAPQRRPFFQHLDWQKCSVPNLQCFQHVDFKMCFALQRRVLFNSSTSKSAPTACIFSTSHSAALRMTCPHFFIARSTLERWDEKIAKRVGTSRQLCPQLSIFAGRSRKRAKERQGDR